MPVLSVQDLELRVGARLLMDEVTFRVDRGDKIGLVGRNGAGKTTLTKTLAGELNPAAGKIERSGEIGYLPQDPRSGNPEDLARTRILDARGLGQLLIGMEQSMLDMASPDDAVSAAAMKKYGNLEERFTALGGYSAEAEAASIASNLSLPDRILGQPLSTLSGGQRRRIELARILFSGADTMLLDEPTNHLDADSVVWLREFLKGFQGGLIVISHDIDLVEETVNKVFYLDANRQTIDIYNMGWKNYIRQRAADEERRKKERVNAEKKAAVLTTQAAKFGAKATKAAAAHQMVARAEKLLAGSTRCAPTTGSRSCDSRIRCPAGGPRSWRPTCPRATARSRSSRPSTSRSTGGRRSSCSGSTARARRRCCVSSPVSTSPTRGRSSPATACGSATTRRSTRPSTSSGRCSRTWCRPRPT